MTEVIVDSQRFANGPDHAQSRGSVTCRPFKLVSEAGAFINTASFVVPYPGAPVTLDLEEFELGNAWDIEIEVDGLLINRLVRPVGDGPVNLADLTNLDRDTLDPEPDAVPVWLEAIDAAIVALQRKDQLDDDNAALVEDDDSATAVAFAAKIAAALAAGDFATATALASLAGALTSETSDRAAADLVNANAIAAIVLANHFTPKGTWTAQTYSALDVVYRNGSSYVATTAALSTDVPGVAALWVPYAIGLDANSAADTFATFDLVGRVKPTRVITDSTTRADSATTSGSAETGQAWTPANTGLWGITGNKMYLVSNGTGIRANLVSGGASLLTWSADITLASGGEGGLVIAAVDSANMFTVALSAATGNLLIYSINAGATSTRLTQAAGIAAGTYNLMASISGDSTAATLSIWLNRVLIKEFAISSTDRTAFLAATKYGAYLASSAQANRVTNIKADSPVTATDRKLIEWDAEEAWAVTAATIDTDGFPSTATVRWPDGTVGTFTLTAKYTGPGVTAINSYTVTYPARGKTLTQAAPTRDPVTSAVLSVPKATVA